MPAQPPALRRFVSATTEGLGHELMTKADADLWYALVTCASDPIFEVSNPSKIIINASG
jgi:hypothetical protein